MAKYRRSMVVDLHPHFGGQGREAYIQVYKNLGFTDICECYLDEKNPTQHNRKRVRPGSGNPGLQECLECHELVWPLCAVYECDECTEPTLSPVYPVPVNEPFLCDDCD